jgi:hypothetical protein
LAPSSASSKHHKSSLWGNVESAIAGTHGSSRPQLPEAGSGER